MEKTYSAIMGNEEWSSEDDNKFEYAEAAKKTALAFMGCRVCGSFLQKQLHNTYSADVKQHSEITKAVIKILKGDE